MVSLDRENPIKYKKLEKLYVPAVAVQAEEGKFSFLSSSDVASDKF